MGLYQFFTAFTVTVRITTTRKGDNMNEQSKKTYTMDMTTGPLAGKIVRYAVPVMLSGILQLLFNAADVVVLGQCAGEDSLAALGPTGSLINLLINVFIGLSVGTNVVVAHFFGAGRDEDVSQTVHTSIAVSLIGGVILIFLGCGLCRPLLEMMSTPDNVIDKSELYMKIYFCGMPAMLLYNYGSAVLRAVGDTKRPLFFLSLAGVINVLLNLLFVIVLRMDVAGVALATVFSQVVSAAMVVICLMKMKDSCRLELRKLHIHREKFLRIVRIGLPAGIQGAVFSISNVLIQSSINSFGSVVMAGNTAAGNLEGFVYNAMNSFYQTNVSFTGQNMGARKYSRVIKTLFICLAMVTVVGLVMGNSFFLLSEYLLRIYNDNPEVIAYGRKRMRYLCVPYFLCGIMDTMVGSIRGIGCSVMPMIVSLLGSCAFRIIWIYTVFAANRSLEVLYSSYPISWGITFAVHAVCFIVVWKRMRSGKGQS